MEPKATADGPHSGWWRWVRRRIQLAIASPRLAALRAFIADDGATAVAWATAVITMALMW